MHSAWTEMRTLYLEVHCKLNATIWFCINWSLDNHVLRLPHSMVVLYTGIMKVWGFWPKNVTQKPAQYLLCDSTAVFGRPSQAQKCLQIILNPFSKLFWNLKKNRIFYWLTEAYVISTFNDYAIVTDFIYYLKCINVAQINCHNSTNSFSWSLLIAKFSLYCCPLVSDKSE